MRDLLEPFPMDWQEQEQKLMAQFRAGTPSASQRT